VLLIDYSLPHLNGFQSAEQLLKKNKELKIILFIMYDTLEIALNFLKIGGRGFIIKGGNNDEIISAIRTVFNGDYYFNSEFENEILRWIDGGKPKPKSSIKFAPKELEIVLKLSKGLTCERRALKIQQN